MLNHMSQHKEPEKVGLSSAYRLSGVPYQREKVSQYCCDVLATVYHVPSITSLMVVVFTNSTTPPVLLY